MKKEKFKCLVVWFFTVVILMMSGHYFWTPLVYRGQEISVSKLRNIERFKLDVADNVVVVEAASFKPFLLRSESGMIIVGEKKDPPLGWPYKEYWKSDQVSIKSDTWYVIEGSQISIDFLPGGFNILLNRSLKLWCYVVMTALFSLSVYLAAEKKLKEYFRNPQISESDDNNTDTEAS